MKKRDIRDMLFWGFLLAGFTGGVLFINLWGNTYTDSRSFYGPDQMKAIASLNTDPRLLFRHIIFERAKGLLLLGLLGCTAAGIPAALLALGFLGAGAGVLLSLCMVRMRFAGIIMFMTAVLPQWLFYMPMIWMLCVQIYERGVQRYRKEIRPDNRDSKRQYLGLLLMTAALLGAGAVMETFANPWLVRQTVNFFL